MEKDNSTKRRVIQIAHKLFKEQGFDAVTINEICKESNISKHTFYYYFTSKEELIMEYFALDISNSEELLSKMLTTADPLEKYKMLSFSFIERCNEAGPEILKRLLMYNLSEKTEERIKKSSHSFTKKKIETKPYRDLRITLLKQAQDEGLITSKMSPEDIEFYQFAIFVGFGQMWATSNGGFDLIKKSKKAFAQLFEEIQT